MFEIGDKVTYITDFVHERGIIKSLTDDNCAFVVYACGEDWENYRDYTGNKTRLVDLVLGWK